MAGDGVDGTTATYVDRLAETTPHGLALVDRNRGLDWAETKRASDELALGLLDRVDPGAAILGQCYNCVELYLLRLACEKAGLRIVTAPTRFRGNELAPILGAVDVELAVVPGEYREYDYVAMLEAVEDGRAPERIVTLDGTGDESFVELSREGDVDRLAETAHGPTDVCQLATTSGSTSGPDCVEVPIAARLRTAREHVRRFGVTPADQIGVVTPLVTGNTDALGYHGAPQVGATVVLVERFDPGRVLDLIDERITVLPLVTTATTKLMDRAQSDERDLSLRTIVNYGSLLTGTEADRARAVFDCEIHQAFGAMDFGGISATSTDDDEVARVKTVGRPLDGNDVRVATDDGDLVDERGVVGTIVARGAHQVGRSVLGRRPETIGSFTVIGDRGTFDDHGRIVLLGRDDDVINRGGRMIYPAEVEDHLAGHPQVADVAVAGVPDDTYGQRVGAFVVPRDGTAVEFEAIVEFLRSKDVAPYKLPERVVAVTELPRVPAGHKVDRRALVDALPDADAIEE